MADPNLTQAVAASWEAKIGKKPEDNIHQSYWFFKNLVDGQGFLSVDGGRLIEVSLEYALNTTFKSYSDLEPIDTTRIDVFDAAQYVWKEVAGTVVVSDKERAFNQGSGAKFPLIPAKLENADNSHDAELNRQILGDGTGNGSKDFHGLKMLVPATPTTGTVGGINRATFSFWRSQTQAGTKTTAAYDNLVSAMTTLYNNCSGGYDGEHPTFGVTTPTIFAAYEGKLQAIEQIVSKSDADIGFKNESLRFKGSRLAYDEMYSANTASDQLHLLNPKYLKIAYQKGFWKKMRDPIRPANQTADVWQIETIGNLILTNSRRVGVVHTIT